jgi:predicted acyl esterase
MGGLLRWRAVPGIVLLAGFASAAEPEIEMAWGVKLPMRNGVKLNATIFKPREMPGPLPAVFTLTPYVADTYHPRAAYFARNDGFPFFSRLLKKGSRLRLFLRCPNTIHLQKNYNSGRPVAEETARDARTAHVTVYHDAAHPSALEVPIGR